MEYKLSKTWLFKVDQQEKNICHIYGALFFGFPLGTTLVRTGPGSEPEEKCCFLPCIRRREDQGPFLTPEEEERLFEEQVENNQGFDINFEEFSCVFNYVPVDFDENYYFKDTDTTRGVIDRLSRDSLGLYNERMGKGYEFVEVIKANTHPTGTAAHIFYITFRAKEPPDDQPKDFQARVCYFCYTSNKYHSCELKPEKKDTIN
ncbi:unnamed protein product [Brassica oleracea var. botrytis]|uniref:Cystatin domain-containing protein n=3 Tax=Brassica TaxID=3705 RepID=A0A8X7QZ01_BRACI|nr:hypothetical protein Bca52824_059945 [Brassica carinata]VDD29465.1 unnamed protein product [Brassica oleracea]